MKMRALFAFAVLGPLGCSADAPGPSAAAAAGVSDGGAAVTSPADAAASSAIPTAPDAAVGDAGEPPGSDAGSCATASLKADHENCGVCRRACAATAACVAGECYAPIDKGWSELEARHLVADGAGAAWLVRGAASFELRAIATDAPSPATVASGLATTGTRAVVLALGPSDVFVGRYTSAGTSIHRVARAGGTFATFGADEDGTTPGNLKPSLAVSSAYVFWVGAKGVYRQGLSGGPSELWTKTACAEHLSVAGETVYWSCYQGNVAHRLASDPVDLATAYPTYPAGESYAVSGNTLWSLSGSTLSAAPLGGSPAPLVTGLPAYTRLLRTDGVTAYFAATTAPPESANTLYAASATLPGSPAVLHRQTGVQLSDLALGGRFLYLMTNGGHVYRSPK